MRWTEHVACIGEMRTAYKIMVGNPEGNRTLDRPSHRWEDIKMDRSDAGCGDDLIHQAHAHMVLNHQVP
jgi:hypothetical protein